MLSKPSLVLDDPRCDVDRDLPGTASEAAGNRLEPALLPGIRFVFGGFAECFGETRYEAFRCRPLAHRLSRGRGDLSDAPRARVTTRRKLLVLHDVRAFECFQRPVHGCQLKACSPAMSRTVTGISLIEQPHHRVSQEVPFVHVSSRWRA